MLTNPEFIGISIAVISILIAFILGGVLPKEDNPSDCDVCGGFCRDDCRCMKRD